MLWKRQMVHTYRKRKTYLAALKPRSWMYWLACHSLRRKPSVSTLPAFTAFAACRGVRQNVNLLKPGRLPLSPLFEEHRSRAAPCWLLAYFICVACTCRAGSPCWIHHAACFARGSRILLFGNLIQCANMHISCQLTAFRVVAFGSALMLQSSVRDPLPALIVG